MKLLDFGKYYPQYRTNELPKIRNIFVFSFRILSCTRVLNKVPSYRNHFSK